MASFADEILNENVPGVIQWLRRGAPVNDVDEYGYTPLIEAAIMDNMEICQILIQQGADVNLADMTGGTALHWAAENNNLALGKLLLEHRADPDAYNLSGQPVLVMPLLRNQTGFKKLLYDYNADLKFAQDFINTKLLGHMYELVGTADIVAPGGKFVEVDYEGFILEFSVGIIGESLQQFLNHFAARQFRRYANIIQMIITTIMQAAYLIRYQQYRIDVTKYQRDIQPVVENEPLLIPVGYEGHAISFIKYGNVLVKCDRREDSRLFDNVMFYRINNPKIMTPEFIQNLIYKPHTSQFINAELHYLLDLKPITELKMAAQISGNCSWANIEAVVPALFFLLLEQGEGGGKDIEKNKSLALLFFERWREWNKDRALQFCIQSFYASDAVRKATKAEIMAAILFQHCDYNSSRERNRVESILSVLTMPQYEYILKNYIKIHCYEGYSEEGKNFARMLKKYGYMK